jgi:glycosyltransferase involved in cell wall biosynthesis
MFLRTCQGLAAELEGWRLIIACPPIGQFGPLLEAAVRRKGASDRVSFSWSPDLSAQRALLGRADLLVAPTLVAQPPVSPLQAMAAGVPVLVSKQVHMADVESSGAGRAFEPSPQSLRKALAELITLPADQLQKMGARAAEVTRQRYDWERLWPQYLALYKSVANTS